VTAPHRREGEQRELMERLNAETISADKAEAEFQEIRDEIGAAGHCNSEHPSGSALFAVRVVLRVLRDTERERDEARAEAAAMREALAWHERPGQDFDDVPPKPLVPDPSPAVATLLAARALAEAVACEPGRDWDQWQDELGAYRAAVEAERGGE
jgi:hypothetical protein